VNTGPTSRTRSCRGCIIRGRHNSEMNCSLGLLYRN
jgi:hypothetical protein